jgi:hypothetical protein
MDRQKDLNRKEPRRSRLSLFSRRRFVKSAGAATVAIGLGTTTSSAEELPRVTEDDTMAKALNYAHDAGTVDAAKRFSDRYCNNCALYAGTANDDWAQCSIFPGKVVAGRGWCSAWSPTQPQ